MFFEYFKLNYKTLNPIILKIQVVIIKIITADTESCLFANILILKSINKCLYWSLTQVAKLGELETSINRK